MDSYGKKAGKGALIQEEISGTLGVSQDQYLFQPILDDQGGQQINVRYDGKAPTLRAQSHGNLPCVVYGVTTKGNGDAFISKERHTSLAIGGGQAGQGYPCVCYGIDTYNQAAEEEIMQTIRTNGGGDCIPKVVYSIENHPNDSRVQFSKDGKVQALTSRMGTGGGNVPMILQSKGCYWDGSQVCGTLTAHNANGAQRMPDKENFTCVIQHIGGGVSPKDRKPYGERLQQVRNARSDERFICGGE